MKGLSGAALLAAAAMAAACAPDDGARETTAEEPLFVYDSIMWTQEDDLVPMCWHRFSGFEQFFDPSAAIARAKELIRNTVQERWLDPLQLAATWEPCPTSGPRRHVRVTVQHDDWWHGNTVVAGAGTLTTAAQRAADPQSLLPGLLMAFHYDWSANDANLEETRALIAHEFGHVLGFGHELYHPDGDPAVDPCYANNDVVAGYAIGPPDPASIMGWAYCTGAGTAPTAGDIAGARGFYGTAPTHFGAPGLLADASCGSGCRLADVDGDGLDDLVDPRQLGSWPMVFVARNLGGSFAPAEIWNVGSCGGGALCELGDVNNDRRADLIVFARGASPVVRVGLSTGSGFVAPAQWTDFACLDGEVCKVADVSYDGRADLVIFTHNAAHQVWVRKALAGGGFGGSELWSSYFCLPGERCDVGDFDRDGRSDIIAFPLGAAGQAWVGLAQPGGGFAGAELWGSGICYAAEECRVADVNYDGHADVVVFGHQASDTGVRVARAAKRSRELLRPVPWVGASFCLPGEQCLVGQLDGAWGADAMRVRATDMWMVPSEP